MKARGVLLLVPLLVLMLIACGRGGSDAPDPNSTPIYTATPAGFLPTRIPTAVPTDPPGTRLGNAGKCPPLPATACSLPGETVNLFQDGSLERASALHLVRYGPLESWVLDSEKVQALLRMFDRDTYLYEYDILPLSDDDHMRLELLFPPGQGIPWDTRTTLDSVEFMIDAGPGLIGHSLLGLQWELPAGFLEAVFASASDVTPTPLPRTPYLTPTPTATVLAPRAVFFNQPAGRLDWDGPDGSVWSSDFGHCSNYQLLTDFGIPGNISIDDDRGFWAITILEPSDEWRWTGYYHGAWQLWQGSDPDVVYLVHMSEPSVAFQYRSSICF